MAIINIIKNIFINTGSTNTVSEKEINNIRDNSKVCNEDNRSTYEKQQATAVFLNWSSGKMLGKSISDYPGYFSYTYGISNPHKFHNDMINDNYLEKPQLDNLFTYFKVPELKQILSDNNLTKTGNKKDLIKRILDNVPQNKLEEIKESFNGYVLSQKGLDFVKEHEDYIKLHKNSRWMISVLEYEEKKQQLKFNATFNDVVWGIFVDRNLQFVSQKQWGLVRNNIHNMSELLYKEKKYQGTLSLLLDVLYYDLSGLENNNILYGYDNLFIAPAIIDQILDLKYYYTDDLINNSGFIKQLPFSYFSIESFKVIVNDLLNNGSTDIDVKKYIHLAQSPSFELHTLDEVTQRIKNWSNGAEDKELDKWYKQHKK